MSLSSVNNTYILEAAGLGEDLLADFGGGFHGRLGELFSSEDARGFMSMLKS